MQCVPLFSDLSYRVSDAERRNEKWHLAQQQQQQQQQK